MEMGRDLFSPAEEGRTLSNGAKLREPRFHLDTRKHFLTVRTPRVWNGLPREVVEAPSVRVFKDRLDMHMVSIVDSGVRGTIAVGLVPQYYSLDHQPGWLPDSVAYHADDGKLYNGRAKGRQFGTKCSSGDRIGCGIEPVSFEVQTAQIFFTKNGKRVSSEASPSLVEGETVPGKGLKQGRQHDACNHLCASRHPVWCL
ncbi:SPRY domain-containing protein 3 [Varanus komodoensis]|nr:SPRY domain-containing protein 3 [Varanus komodoensis]